MTNPTRRLSDVLAAAPSVASRSRVVPPLTDRDPEVTAVDFDSRHVGSGSMFVAVRGDHADGHDFVGEAVRNGASVVVVDHEVAAGSATTQLVVADTTVAMGRLAAAYWDHPGSSMTMVGVTGTNGKTTTTQILANAFDRLGSPAGVIGTLSGAKTTPEAPELQARLAAFRDSGTTAVAMEVSSHALALGRVIGTSFDVGVFTNLGRDHLDLHGTEEQYFAAKAKLFTPELSRHAVLNVDDVHGRLLADTVDIPFTTFSFADADDVVVGPFEHEYTWRGHRLRVGLGGRFNVMNSLAAATVLEVLGHDPADIAAALATTPPVRGRFEPVAAGQDFAVVVDFAHTPDALTEVLSTAREIAGGHRVIVVFGCGGDRDRDKRPQMGLAASLLADQLVVTSDNPRSEDPQAIVNDIIGGIPPDYRGVIAMEIDRRDAIATALRSAQHGDIVVIAGKGHETSQVFRDRTVDFDDRAVAGELLAGIVGGGAA